MSLKFTDKRNGKSFTLTRVKAPKGGYPIKKMAKAKSVKRMKKA